MTDDEMTKFAAQNAGDYLIDVSGLMHLSTDAVDGRIDDPAGVQPKVTPVPGGKAAVLPPASAPTPGNGSTGQDKMFAARATQKLFAAMSSEDYGGLLSLLDTYINRPGVGPKVAAQLVVAYLRYFASDENPDHAITELFMTRKENLDEYAKDLYKMVESGTVNGYEAGSYEFVKEKITNLINGSAETSTPEPDEPESQEPEPEESAVPEPEWGELGPMESILKIDSQEDLDAALKRYDYLVELITDERFDDLSQELSRKGIVEKFIRRHLQENLGPEGNEVDPDPTVTPLESSAIPWASNSKHWRKNLARELENKLNNRRDVLPVQRPVAEAPAEAPAEVSEQVRNEIAKFDELFAMAKAAHVKVAPFNEEKIMAFSEAILANKEPFMAARKLAAAIGMGSGHEGRADEGNFFMQMNQHIQDNILSPGAKIRNDFIKFLEKKESDPDYDQMDIMNYETDIAYLTKELDGIMGKPPEAPEQNVKDEFIAKSLEAIQTSHPNMVTSVEQGFAAIYDEIVESELGEDDIGDLVSYIATLNGDTSVVANGLREIFVTQ